GGRAGRPAAARGGPADARLGPPDRGGRPAAAAGRRRRRAPAGAAPVPGPGAARRVRGPAVGHPRPADGPALAGPGAGRRGRQPPGHPELPAPRPGTGPSTGDTELPPAGRAGLGRPGPLGAPADRCRRPARAPGRRPGGAGRGRRAPRPPPRGGAGPGAAGGRWRGEPLADLTRLPAFAPDAAQVRMLLTDATLTLGERRLAEGDTTQALHLAERVLAADAAAERALRLLLAAHLHRGEPVAVTAAVRRVEAALSDLGVRPEPPTAMLIRQARLRLAPPSRPAARSRDARGRRPA